MIKDFYSKLYSFDDMSMEETLNVVLHSRFVNLTGKSIAVSGFSDYDDEGRVRVYFVEYRMRKTHGYYKTPQELKQYLCDGGRWIKIDIEKL